LKNIKKLVLVCTLLIATILFAFSIEDTQYKEIKLSFKSNKNVLEGTLVLPKNKQGPYPLVIFIHGDGALPYDAYGYYNPLWQELAKRGIASFSWNKAGVENSTGNWYFQTMEQRANEVVDALNMIKEHEDISKNEIGAISYSQAGWVIPMVSKKTDILRFNVIVSGAISWMEQNQFTTKLKLKELGYSKSKIKKALTYNSTLNSTYEGYLKNYNKNAPSFYKELYQPMNFERFTFSLLNHKSDSTKSLKYIKTPTLAIFGKNDTNIDVKNTINVYKKEFHENLIIKRFDNAQHSLLSTQYFENTKYDWWHVLKFELLQEEAFPEHYLNFMVNWIEEAIKINVRYTSENIIP